MQGKLVAYDGIFGQIKSNGERYNWIKPMDCNARFKLGNKVYFDLESSEENGRLFCCNVVKISDK